MSLRSGIVLAAGLLCLLFGGARFGSGAERWGEAPSGPMLLETAASAALLDSARLELSAYRMDEAEGKLRRLERLADGLPAARYHLALVALHRALMSDEDEHFDDFHARSDSLDDALNRAEPSAWRDFMKADRDLWRAIVFLKRERFLRAAWSGRSAYRTYARVVASHPRLYDAYRGLGVLHLAIGSMPRTYRFLLDVLGFDGGIKRGIGELEMAYRDAVYASEEAGVMLALTRQMLHLDERKGLSIAADLMDRHPDSPLYGHVYGFVLVANRHADAAVVTLREAVRRSERSVYFYDHYLDFYLAEALFRTDAFAEAEHYYRQYIQRHGGPALKAMAYLGLGKSLEMQGRRGEAVEMLEEVRSAREFDTDAAAKREAERLLAAPISPRDRTLLLAANAFDRDQLEDAVGLLSTLTAEGGLTIDQAAEAAYRLGRAHLAGRRPAEALAAFERAESLQGDPLSRWAPWSAFYTAKLHLQEERHVEAREAFRRALAYGGAYDYYQALEQGTRAALEFLPE